jgi:hypothetical protein
VSAVGSKITQKRATREKNTAKREMTSKKAFYVNERLSCLKAIYKFNNMAKGSP